MATSATILSRVVLTDANGLVTARDELEGTIASVLSANGKLELVTIINGFTALSPPTGATFVRIVWVSGTGTVHLKNVTGDTTGIACGVLTATSPAIQLPLSSAGIGILGSAAGTLEVRWL